MRNVPIGVVPSPSRRFRRSPFQPTRAGNGPATARQQPPARRHVRSVACVVRAVGAVTVISCRPRGSGSRLLAALAGQAIAAAAASEATSTGAQSTLTWVRNVGLLLAAALAAAATAAAAPVPEFAATVSPVRWPELRFTYRAGCPVPPRQLRTLRVSHWGFDRRARVGVLIVHRRVAGAVVSVFRRLYAARFPIRLMVPVSRYRGSDGASMAADNTSGFNCRRVPGSTRWSEHAYGLAIDVNPVENPYVVHDSVLPPAGRRYLDRRRYRRGMAVRGGVLVRAFASVGWKWG